MQPGRRLWRRIPSSTTESRVGRSAARKADLSFYFDLSGEDIIDAEGRGYFVAAAFSICFSYSRN